MVEIAILLVILAGFSYWIAHRGPAWCGAFLLFLPLQVIGLALLEPPFISRQIGWLSPVPITAATALILTLIVQCFRWRLPWAGALLPKYPRLDSQAYPWLLLGTPAAMLAALSFGSMESSIIAVGFYGMTYLTLAILVVSFLEWKRDGYPFKIGIILAAQLLLLVFALLRGSGGEVALLLARFSTPIIAALITLMVAKKKQKRRAILVSLIIMIIALASIGLVNYAADQDNLAELLYSAYNQGVTGGGRGSLSGSVLAIIGKLVARQDYNEMLRSLTALDYRYLVNSFDSITYSLDSVLRLVGIRGYEHPIGQLLFFLREETRSINLFPSANIPAGLIVVLLSRQSWLLLSLTSGVYALLFSSFLAAEPKSLDPQHDRLHLIRLALSGELACLFELTPEFGLQVAPMALGSLWIVLLMHRFLRQALVPALDPGLR